ncbi:hypothetical protein KC318_g15223 [Hortaea werneckii]|uniref:EF-hand domain-containing protein n=1 Tax=Hortaea werneckii TaxID=91943 RepID=A0A3M6YDN0_HORWE|nr:hypothetical protein KC334_g15794 [Hortaea werneckii]KAI6982433.1 hypothetical protein KC355_g10937 [Hortaea werneckii]KAI7652090.1 hypothetical protein KC318_g15223 [Hortaea werneckii]RMX95943.1 hypothetical protein D0867_13316 [Hortaea werneckii]RMY00962.1 hypothetical protein D0866_15858 [Hortaea werneckii]
MATQRPLSFHDTGRQSPFRRQNSASPATMRQSTLSSSPTKNAYAPNRPSSLSPEKTSPFVRRPSQISPASSRPSSPFARPSSGLGTPQSPSRRPSNTSNDSRNDRDAPPSPRPLPSPSPRISPPAAQSQEEGAGDHSMKSPPAPSSPAIMRESLSPTPFDGPTDTPSKPEPPSQANLRPTMQRNVTSSTMSTVRPPPTFNNSSDNNMLSLNKPSPRPNAQPRSAAPGASRGGGGGGGGYNHIPQPLLRSMRESFEVLDASNTGFLDPKSITNMLEQMGMDSSSRSLGEFFPPSSSQQQQQLTLARYLDTLSGPLKDLSDPDELQAAFEAFDVDDSGQIDLAELRRAILSTAAEPADDDFDFNLSEREIDGILGEFASRRAFGSKGLNAAGKKGGGRGEVFRYRDFMASAGGGGAGDAGGGEGGGEAIGVGA